MFYSPLRYPGGKNKLATFIAKICVDNNINGHYVEPYSGGASVALFLLLEGFVERITINDKDRSIYAFWHSVLNNTNKLCEMIEKVDLSIKVWEKQREIQKKFFEKSINSEDFVLYVNGKMDNSGLNKKDFFMEKSWARVLGSEFEKEYMKNLQNFLLSEIESNQTIFPPKKMIFNAFCKTPYDKVKVVIVGQDPYHGKGQAHGLSFSVPKEIKAPPSLKNIFQEQVKDIGIKMPVTGELTPWAKQGVLLLNASLTVRKSEANSHQSIGWQIFTDAVIQHLSAKRENIIFLLWGGFAKKKGAKINADRKSTRLNSSHTDISRMPSSA